ncbi:MAG: NAD-dependent DNA ligase LigA [Clostridiales bacterium]|nr:NAD-dependent DNA ligase LigA [Clostridiales bacterium]
MRVLVDQINEASWRYYVEDDPILSDQEWDRLYDQLLEMERQAGMVLPDSPTRRVGGEPLAAFKQHRHLSRLWSMDKVQSPEALRQWLARAQAMQARQEGLPPLQWAVEYKYDGLTVNLTYRDGALVHAATRGNGQVGEEILPQAMTVRGIPLSIPYRGLMEIHGECIMRLSELKRFNQTAAEPLKNARNAAAGALRNLDPQVTASRRLNAYFYEVGYIEDPPYQDQVGMMRFIRENGFPVSPLLAVSADPEEINAAVARVEAQRETLDFLIDGAVVKITDKATREAFGYTDKFPRWAVACKFAAEESTTTLERVTWEPGRTGKLTPLGHVMPVEFSGVTVRKATLNNWGDIQRKRLSLGATVWIRRSNDVIPEIMGVVADDAQGLPIDKPEHCPACGSQLEEIGANLFCLNRDGCKPQVVARLTHYAGRDAMDIAGFSEKTAELFFDRLGVQEPDQLYTLTREQLLGLPGFLDKKADNLIEGIRASRDCQLDAFLFAIGIPNIGRGTARDIAAELGSLDAVRAAGEEQLSAIPGVGGVLVQSMVDFFRDPQNVRLIDSLLALGVRPHDMQLSGAPGRLTGQSVVVTGTLPTLSRQQAEELIRRHGGIAASAVSRKTAFVLCGESAGSKLQKAQQLGIPVLDEAAFLKLIQE